jgi:hypothetical protein
MIVILKSMFLSITRVQGQVLSRETARKCCTTSSGGFIDGRFGDVV